MRIPKGHDVNNDNKKMNTNTRHASLEIVTLFILYSLHCGERHCHPTFLGGRPCDFVNLLRVSARRLLPEARQLLSPNLPLQHSHYLRSRNKPPPKRLPSHGPSKCPRGASNAQPPPLGQSPRLRFGERSSHQ